MAFLIVEPCEKLLLQSKTELLSRFGWSQSVDRLWTMVCYIT